MCTLIHPVGNQIVVLYVYSPKSVSQSSYTEESMVTLWLDDVGCTAYCFFVSSYLSGFIRLMPVART